MTNIITNLQAFLLDYDYPWLYNDDFIKEVIDIETTYKLIEIPSEIESAELINHLKMNGYDFTNSEDNRYLLVNQEEYDYVLTCIEDRMPVIEEER